MAAPTPRTTGSLNFSVPPKDGSRAYVNINDSASDLNYTYEAHEVPIWNLRGNESAATLDTAGFQLYNHPAKHTAFTNDADVKKEYYPESMELIKRLTGASRVVLFDHSTSLKVLSQFPKVNLNFSYSAPPPQPER
jgi:hypothetical protein